VSVTAQTTEQGIEAKIVIAEGRQVEQPIHLCFGLFERFGVQNVVLDLVMEANAQATLWSHCLFSVPDVARHAMQAVIRVGPGAELRYQEAHYHGASGGMEVVPRARVELERGARGHVDCTEIIRDRGMVSASPVVKVTHPEAKVTHEAAIGSVDRQQMETLMARGLAPEEAVYRIVGGLLR
jgi:Fe-S cluster assembly scaffold protein SufB